MKRLAFALIVAAFTTSAAAHDYAKPNLDEWFHGLHGGEGGSGNWCCNGGEAAAVLDPDWISEDGHYKVRVDGQWYEVPDSALVRGPNLDGPALVWMNKMYNGGSGGDNYSVRCFLPGSGT